MPNLNEVRLMGHLGADPELKRTQKGTPVVTLSIATNHSYKKSKDSDERVDQTEWHRVTVWDKRAQFVADTFKKGDPIFVGGRLQTRKWTDDKGIDRWTTEIVALGVQHLKPKPKAQAPIPEDDQYVPSAPGDDDIPF